MTDPTERTARWSMFRQRCSQCGYVNVSHDPNDTHCTAQFAGGYQCTGEFDDDGPVVGWWDLCEALVLPTDMTPARLAADLAIAARVRATSFTDAGPPEYRLGHNRLLERLLNGDR